MLDLNFTVDGAAPEPYAATPLLMFKLRVTQGEPVVPIHNVALNCQLRIEPTRRRYDDASRRRLRDLFGEPERWGRTVRSMLWTHAATTVPPFTEGTVVDLPVPCTFDFNVAATKYFHGLEEGDIPLCLLFSGTVFYAGDDGRLQVGQIPWEKEADYRLPVRVWEEMMEVYYPNTAWLCLRRDVFDRLHGYKTDRGIPTWEQTLEALLPDGEGGQAREP